MLTLTSPDGATTCVISPESGGRIESITRRPMRDGTPSVTDYLIRRGEPSTSTDDPFSWGSFTMVPFCGRVRGGRLRVGDEEVQLFRRFGPHAMHGTVVDLPWDVFDHSVSSASLTSDLGPMWPFAGSLRHDITLADHGIVMVLTLTASRAMPAQLGWHPWFRRPVDYSLPFEAMLERDLDGIATSRRTPPVPGNRGSFDDCFVGRLGPIVLHYDEGDLALASDCSHWTIFDQRPHGICVEPQSGPPNGINDCPEILAPGDELSRWFTIGWEHGSRR